MSLSGRVLRLISGQARGLGPGLLRAVLLAAEAPYSLAIRLRNALYKRGMLRIGRLPRPVISVGNLTAGGTGKTPVVRWLAQQFAQQGRRPAILLRGYKSQHPQAADEATMLQEMLRRLAIVHAQPDRLAGGRLVLRQHPDVDLFILDDGFQHRRLHRDFDLVLVDVTNPLGFEHVHPRGLLREPPSGLQRADAILLTRCSAVDAEQCGQIETLLRRWNSHAPIFRSSHVHASLRSAGCPVDSAPDVPMAALSGRRFFACAGIANPQPLFAQLAGCGGTLAGTRAFPDHHAYSESDWEDLQNQSAAVGAQLVLVTEKDWVKLRHLSAVAAGQVPLLRLDLQLAFENDHEARLLELITGRLS
jgi:tetraacyldisaccharide 4'-kinase